MKKFALTSATLVIWSSDCDKQCERLKKLRRREANWPKFEGCRTFPFQILEIFVGECIAGSFRGKTSELDNRW